MYVCIGAGNGRSRPHASDTNRKVTFVPPSLRDYNPTHNSQSPSHYAGTASPKTHGTLPLREATVEGEGPNQPNDVVSPLRGSLPSTTGALSPCQSWRSTQQSPCGHPAAQGMENQPPIQAEGMNWTLNGYLQRQKAHGGVQGTAPYLRLRQSRQSDQRTSLIGNVGSSVVQSPPPSGLDSLHFSKYGTGAARYRWVPG